MFLIINVSLIKIYEIPYFFSLFKWWHWFLVVLTVVIIPVLISIHYIASFRLGHWIDSGKLQKKESQSSTNQPTTTTRMDSWKKESGTLKYVICWKNVNIICCLGERVKRERVKRERKTNGNLNGNSWEFLIVIMCVRVLCVVVFFVVEIQIEIQEFKLFSTPKNETKTKLSNRMAIEQRKTGKNSFSITLICDQFSGKFFFFKLKISF